VGSVGVYVHVPFCERVCPYCDFAVVAARPLAPGLEERYVAAVLRELEGRRAPFAGRGLASIYFGGGTPALLRPGSLERILAAVRGAFPAAGPVEVTLEANPSTLERARLPAFRALGVNRLSLGIQSFDDTVLRRLGRAHRAEAGRAALRAAREAGFANLSLDLIFAAPGQDLAALEADLAEAAAFAPEHVSAYALTLESGTPFARAAARGRLALPDEDLAAAMMVRVAERLEAAGLPSYELSSFARPGFEAVHNARYWARRPVLGLGMGAWSSDPASPEAPFGSRRANLRELGAYLAAVETGQSPEREREVLAAPVARGEAAFLALRTRRGLEAAAFAREFGVTPRALWGEAIEALRARGLLSESPGGDLALTAPGRLLADSVFEAFVESTD
jgi:putative oxygen-independent coproporphyrinogen III oxidase